MTGILNFLKNRGGSFFGSSPSGLDLFAGGLHSSGDGEEFERTASGFLSSSSSFFSLKCLAVGLMNQLRSGC